MCSFPQSVQYNRRSLYVLTTISSVVQINLRRLVSLTLRAPEHMGQTTRSLLLMKNIQFTVVDRFVM